MWGVLIFIILLIITGCSLFMIDKLFLENAKNVKNVDNVDNVDNVKNSIKPDNHVDTVEISSDYIIILSMEKCPYCEILQKDYISKTEEKHTIITYKSREKTFSFDTNFIDIPAEERENIIDEVDKLLKGPFIFPTIIHNKKITRGLVEKPVLNKIFNI